MLFKNRKPKMKIAYLLEDTSLCGGVKVVFEHARLLAERGLSVTIFSRGKQSPYFHSGNAEFVSVEKPFADIATSLLRFDIVIATYPGQAVELYRFPINLVLFSQAYEAFYPYWKPMEEEIEKGYRLSIPKMTISKGVASFIKEHFGQSAYHIPQGIDLDIFRAKRTSNQEINKVILVGVWENGIKGIRDGVTGFVMAKKEIGQLKLVRVSTIPLSREERSLYEPDECHIAVPPAEMGKIYRQCDLAIVPSLEGEGFGLPAIEAMACGLPALLTKIHSFLSLHDTKDYAYFVSPRSPEEIADGIIQLCRRHDLAASLREKGRRVAEGFPLGNTVERLIEVLGSVASGRRTRTREEISFVYIERPLTATSMETILLKELSRESFSAGQPIKNIVEAHPAQITVNEILRHSDAPLVAVSLDDTTYFSRDWVNSLLEALEKGFDLVSPVCSDFVEIDMPYYSPLTFEDVSEQRIQTYREQYLREQPFPLLSFIVRRKSLLRLDPDMPLSELPKKLKSASVLSSLVHRFGDYYASRWEDTLRYLPHGLKKVLDVGCAKGFLGELIKKERGCKVIGVEIVKDIAEEARNRLDEVFCMDIEKSQLPFNEDIDAIVFPYVLEHLYDPWRILREARTWLKPDGMVVASIPNAAHYSIILDLLRNRWDYIPFGLLCVTHVRFFTRRSIEEMFRKSGYSLLTLAPQEFPLKDKSLLLEMLNKYIKIENAPDDIFYPNYYVAAKKSTY